MALFNFKKKDTVLDLGERYRKQQERAAQASANQESDSQTSSESQGSDFLGSIASEIQTVKSTEDVDLGASVEERKKKLAKRLMDMTTKIEDFSNQIYHLQQRVELLERKIGVRIE